MVVVVAAAEEEEEALPVAAPTALPRQAGADTPAPTGGERGQRPSGATARGRAHRRRTEAALRGAGLMTVLLPPGDRGGLGGRPAAGSPVTSGRLRA